MKQLKQVSKKVLSALMMPFVAGAIYLAPTILSAEQTQQEKPAVVETKKENKFTFTLEDQFSYDNGLNNDRTRLTLEKGNWLFRFDKNTGKKDQSMLLWTPIKNKNFSFTAITGHDPAKTIDGKLEKETTDLGFSASYNVGELPGVGKTKLTLFNMNVFKPGEDLYNKVKAGMFTEKLDLVCQRTWNRDGTKEDQYYAAVFGKHWYVSGGKREGNKIQGVVVTKDLPVTNMGFGYYDQDNKEFDMMLLTALKNPDTNIYNQGIGRLLSSLFTVGTKPINFPIFTHPTSTGGLVHVLTVNTKPGETRIGNQLGIKIADKITVAPGIFYKKIGEEPAKISPMFSVAAKVMKDGWLEASYTDGKASAYFKKSFSF